ncbi:Anaphase-promoting complex subunit 2 [Bienertia sinuspersici]
MESISLCDFNLQALDSLTSDSIEDILESWNSFCASTDALLSDNVEVSVEDEFVSHVHSLCNHHLSSLVGDYFLQSLEDFFSSFGKEQNNKRIHLRDGTTLPIHMKDISAIEDLSPKMSKSLIYNLRTLHEKIMKNEAIKKEEEQLEKQESEDTKHTWAATVNAVIVIVIVIRTWPRVVRDVSREYLSADEKLKRGKEMVMFETRGASRFWQHFNAYIDVPKLLGQNEESGLEEVLYKALEEISSVKKCQERSLLMLIHSLQSHRDHLSDKKNSSNAERVYLLSKYQLMVSSVLMASLPRQFPGMPCLSLNS